MCPKNHDLFKTIHSCLLFLESDWPLSVGDRGDGDGDKFRGRFLEDPLLLLSRIWKKKNVVKENEILRVNWGEIDI